MSRDFGISKEKDSALKESGTNKSKSFSHAYIVQHIRRSRDNNSDGSKHFNFAPSFYFSKTKVRCI